MDNIAVTIQVLNMYQTKRILQLKRNEKMSYLTACNHHCYAIVDSIQYVMALG